MGFVFKRNMFLLMLVSSLIIHFILLAFPLSEIKSNFPEKDFIELKITLGGLIESKLESTIKDVDKSVDKSKVVDKLNEKSDKIVEQNEEKAVSRKTDSAKLTPVLENMVYESSVELTPTSNTIDYSQEVVEIGVENGNVKEKKINKSLKLNYEKILPLWLHKFLEYPEEANAKGLTGEGMIFITIDRDGNIVFAQIKESTGHDILDKALVEMIRKANPVVPLPDDYHPKKRTRSYEIKFRF